MLEPFDLAVIGSGPGGYVAAIRAAQLGLKVACIEKDQNLGGTCLNVGCIPSKALLHASELYWKSQTAFQQFGIHFSKCSYDFAKMMQKKEEIISSFNQGIASLFKKNRISCFYGIGALSNHNKIIITSKEKPPQEIIAKHILLATGSEPIPLPFMPFDEKRILSSTGALSLTTVPKKMVVVGAGIIGVELGSVYARLGTDVTFIEFLDRVCPTLDESLSHELKKILEHQGMHFHLLSKVDAAHALPDGSSITLAFVGSDQKIQELTADVVLVCIGRRPFTQGLQLEQVGLKVDAKGFLPIDQQFRTQISHIFAIGDLVDGPMLAHKASEEGAAVAEIIAGHTPKIEYAAIPNVVYTDPEVASVGLTEQQAKEAGLQYKTGVFHFKANSRARCTAEEEGFVKILADHATDRLLGIHILGAHASELIAEGVLAIQKRLKIKDLIETPHAHPTLSEAIKEAALSVEKRAIHK